jgi:hypothetical protein
MSKFQTLLDKISVDNGFTLAEVAAIHTHLKELRQHEETFTDHAELSGAFIFASTEQGADYWYDIAVRLGEYEE